MGDTINEPVDFTETRNINLSWDELRRSSIQLLGANNFQVVNDAPGIIEFRGPGMNSTRQSPVVGASFIRLKANHGSVTLEAGLGGAKWMAKFIRYFPIALLVGLELVFAVVFGLVLPNPILGITIATSAVGINLMIWSIIAGPMSRKIEERSKAAISGFMTNAISMATVR